ncbi:hypothetical protein [Spirosoma luteum]|uniref:hypothetical protein n=1 Tax=Spirosoma luteum TaxID=431553 RepID=UPI0003742FF6|nr:hypothetical protein [Spirosoma luteum]
MKYIVVVLLVVVFVRCMSNLTPQTAQNTATDKLTIRTGTSFNMCAGYCRNDYVFNGTSVTLAQNGALPQAQVTPRSCQSAINQTQWNDIKTLANLDAFGKIANVLGCPDCTDGGAEYIEIQVDNQKHRVTFPYGKTIPGFETLVDILRTQRNTFKTCP